MSPEHVALLVPILTTAAVVIGVVFVLRGPVGKAMARRLEGGSLQGGDPAARVEELEARVAELERDRVELAERIEFTERMLTQVRQGQRELR